MDLKAVWQPDSITDRLRGVAYIQPVREILALQPIDPLPFLGLTQPVHISGLFSHIGLHLLNANGETIAEAHGLSHSAQHGYGSIGTKDATLRAHVIRPGSRPIEHQKIQGALHRVDRAKRSDALEQLQHYTSRSMERRRPYGVPADIIRNILLREMKSQMPDENMDPTEARLMARRRRKLAPFIERMPLWLFAMLVRSGTQWRASVFGNNSNSVAGDIGAMFNINIRSLYSHAEAPFIHRSVKLWQQPMPPKAKPAVIQQPTRQLVPAFA